MGRTGLVLILIIGLGISVPAEEKAASAEVEKTAVPENPKPIVETVKTEKNEYYFCEQKRVTLGDRKYDVILLDSLKGRNAFIIGHFDDLDVPEPSVFRDIIGLDTSDNILMLNSLITPRPPRNLHGSNGWVAFGELIGDEEDCYRANLCHFLWYCVSFDLNFKGGTLGDFIGHVSKQYQTGYQKLPAIARACLPSQIEFQLSPIGMLRVANIHVPPIETGGTTMADINDENEIFQYGAYLEPTIDLSEFSTPTSKLTIRLEPSGALLEEVAEIAVYNLSRLQKVDRNLKVEDVVSAIKAVWDMDGAAYLEIIKYHEPTKSLIIKGTGSQIELSDRVYSELAMIKDEKPKASPEQEELSNAVAELKEIRKLLEEKNKGVDENGKSEQEKREK